MLFLEDIEQYTPQLVRLSFDATWDVTDDTPARLDFYITRNSTPVEYPSDQLETTFSNDEVLGLVLVGCSIWEHPQ